MQTAVKVSDTADRRVNLALRKRVAEMTAEEMQTALLTDWMTGLSNRRAWEERENPLPFTVAIDVDGLKTINDTFGHRAGDALLIAVATALTAAGVQGYRFGGDEYAAEFGSAVEAYEATAKANCLLKEAVFSWADDKGDLWEARGAGFSCGIGQDEGEADADLRRVKGVREKFGLRGQRGAAVPGLTVRRALSQADRDATAERMLG